jgi:hypothetical protein
MFVVCFAVYQYRPVVTYQSDNAPLRLLPLLIYQHGTLDFSAFGPDVLPDTFSFGMGRGGAKISKTPLGSAFLAVPVYWLGFKSGLEISSANLVWLDSLSASLMTAIAAGLLAGIVSGYGWRVSVFLTLAFAFGTASWSTASRGLSQHTGGQLGILLALAGLRYRGAHGILAGVAAGLGLGMAIWSRPALGGVCLIILATMAWCDWRRALAAVASGSLTAALWIWHNITATGSPLGVYVSAAAEGATTGVFAFGSFLTNLSGFLFSPNRGMVVFAPVLLLALPAAVLILRKPREYWFEGICLICAALAIGLYGTFFQWHGGHCYGSRYMLDSSPFLIVASAPAVAVMLRSAWRAMVPLALLLLAAGVQGLGVAREWETWNERMDMAYLPKSAWNWRQSQIAHCWTLGESTIGPLREPAHYTVPADGVIRLSAPETPYVRAGFRKAEAWGTWSFAPRAKLVINLPVSRDISVTPVMVAHATLLDPVQVSVRWNGSEIGRVTLRKTDFSFQEKPTFSVPAEQVRAGLNELEFVYNHAHYDGPCSNAFGVGFAAVIVRPRAENASF